MSFRRVRLASIGFELAPVVVSSREIEDRLSPLYEHLRLPAGQLESLTGISERRWWPEGTALSEAAALAAERALELARVEAGAVGQLIYAGVCREGFEPATACAVAARLTLSSTAILHDVSNACLGVLDGILEIANRIELGQISAGLVVSSESSREIIEIAIDRLNSNPSMESFTPAVATLTGGSGAVAVLLVADDGDRFGECPQLLGAVHGNATEHHQLCRWGVKPDPSATSIASRVEFMETDSVAVLRHGVELGTGTFERFLAEMSWQASQVDRVICHQVGASHRQEILPAMGIPPEKDFITYPYLGNIGTVSLPLTAALAWERGFLEKGQKVGFLGIGSGLVCTMLGWEW